MAEQKRAPYRIEQGNITNNWFLFDHNHPEHVVIAPTFERIVAIYEEARKDRCRQ